MRWEKDETINLCGEKMNNSLLIIVDKISKKEYDKCANYSYYVR